MEWWRGNCENSPLPTIGSVFQCVKVDLPSCADVCTCMQVLKWYSSVFFFLLKKVNIPPFVHWNYCSALSMVVPPRGSERYTNCLSIIYMYTKSGQSGKSANQGFTVTALPVATGLIRKRKSQRENIFSSIFKKVCLMKLIFKEFYIKYSIIINDHSHIIQNKNNKIFWNGKFSKITITIHDHDFVLPCKICDL